MTSEFGSNGEFVRVAGVHAADVPESADAMTFDAGGVVEISRGSSAATTPGPRIECAFRPGRGGGELRGAAARLALCAALAFTACRREDSTVRVTLGDARQVVVVIEDAQARPVRRLHAGETLPPGAHALKWDGLDDHGAAVAPGEYRWRGATHRALRAESRAVVCAGPGGGFGFAGAPAAVAADDSRIFLAWEGGRLAACDLEGKVAWSVALPEGTQCRALGIDDGKLFALARRGGDSPADEVLRFDAQSGAPVPWPRGASLPIAALWPADGETQPMIADGLGVRSARLYLTFTAAQFFAVLDARTGDYLQTVVGAPPHLIDITPTKTESPDRPGELIDADFALIALHGGVLGKVLFAHDPLWVVTSELQPLDREERITALTVRGDGARHHRHKLFVGIDAPFRQVQRRSVLDTVGYEWSAGTPGGRSASGPWKADALGPIRGVAIDGAGRLWVAEGDDTPPRFSVWSTEEKDGALVREVFGPLLDTQAAALFPADPAVFIAGGCEWRCDRAAGEVRCLGVLTREALRTARFVAKADGSWELHTITATEQPRVFARRGDGDYELLPASAPSPEPRETEAGAINTSTGRVTFAADWTATLESALPLGEVAHDSPATPLRLCSVVRTAEGKIHALALGQGVHLLEFTGLAEVQKLPGGKINPPRP